MHLLGKLADDTVDEVAQLLASMYVDDNHARSKIQKTLDEHQIQYEHNVLALIGEEMQ